MKEFIWHLRCMIAAKKHRHYHDQFELEYQWYKYLVMSEIRSFFAFMKRRRSNDEIPF